jgi:hypothetical protein
MSLDCQQNNNLTVLLQKHDKDMVKYNLKIINQAPVSKCTNGYSSLS